VIAGAGRWPTRLKCTLYGTCGLAHTWVGIVKISRVHLKPLEMDPLGADQSSVELRDRDLRVQVVI
jgi:hypothetical protein